MKEVFDRWGIEFWIDQGTLLGAVRDNTFLAWDDDIDLGVWKADLDATPQIWKDFRTSGFLVFFLGKTGAVRIELEQNQIGWRSIDVHRCERVENESVKHFGKPKRPGLQRLLMKYIVMIDTVNEAKHGPDLRYKNIKGYLEEMALPQGKICFPSLASQSSTFFNACLKLGLRILPDPLLDGLKHVLVQLRYRYCLDLVRLQSPARYFDTLEEIDFLGLQVHAPTPVREYLSFKYGPDWETPKRNWVYYEEDGA